METDNLAEPVWGTAWVADGIASYDDLGAAISASLPNTALDRRQSSAMPTVVGFGLLTVGLGFAASSAVSRLSGTVTPTRDRRRRNRVGVTRRLLRKTRPGDRA